MPSTVYREVISGMSIKPSSVICLLGLSLGQSQIAFGAWTGVAHFDDPSDAALIVDQETIVGSNARSVIENGSLSLYPGDLFDDWSYLWTTLTLPVDLKAASEAVGGPITAYYEIQQPTVNGRKAIVDTSIGLSNVDEVDVLYYRFNSFSAQTRIYSPSDEFRVRNGGSFETITSFDANTWYGVWFIVDYQTHVFGLYLQGGSQFLALTKIESSDAFWSFRISPSDTDTVDKFLFGLSRGNSVDGPRGIDPTLVDNIYIDTSGVNLSVPPRSNLTGPGIFKSLSIDADGWVTTSLIGSVYTRHYPWCYARDLDTWFFVSEPSENLTTDGVWIYVLN